jgi:hypothetical protein
MRHLVSAAIGAAFLACAAGAAPARDLRVAIDSDTGAVGVSGWSRRVAETGTIFYTCEADFCGRGAIVSMRKQSPPIILDAEGLLRNDRRNGEAMRERSQGRIDAVESGRPIVANDGPVRTGEIGRTVLPAKGGDPGVHLHWRTGYVTGPDASHSLSSSADSRQKCEENFRIFKLALMVMGARDPDVKR